MKNSMMAVTATKNHPLRMLMRVIQATSGATASTRRSDNTIHSPEITAYQPAILAAPAVTATGDGGRVEAGSGTGVVQLPRG